MLPSQQPVNVNYVDCHSAPDAESRMSAIPDSRFRGNDKLQDVRFGVDGALSLEFEGNPDDPVAEIKECLAVAAEAARKVTSA